MSGWRESWRASPAAKALADRHYSRQNPEADQFVPPGRCLVLLHSSERALWVTSWQDALFSKHAWPGAWVCTLFRNEGAGLSSDLIRAAVAHTRWRWPEPPAAGLITFVDPSAVRRKRDPGRCFLRAGFHPEGRSRKRGYLAFRLPPEEMPPPAAPFGSTLALFPGDLRG